VSPPVALIKGEVPVAVFVTVISFTADADFENLIYSFPESSVIEPVSTIFGVVSVGDVRVLFVNVWVSVSPTIVPDGAVTAERTPEANFAIPVAEARLIVFPPVPENRATSESTEVAVLEETSPLPEGVAQVPSPRQKVDDEALVPLFKFVTGRFPVT
jgi:hypothetical protein